MIALEERRHSTLERGDLRLVCSRSGLTLGGVPLLCKGEKGFAPRPPEQLEALMRAAYRDRADRRGLLPGLHGIAALLNQDELTRAMIATVFLRLPELDWAGAARIAAADSALAR